MVYCHHTIRQREFLFDANAIATYLQNIPFQNNHSYMISREEGFDLQIKQRVLTKIRGTEMMVGSLLSEEVKENISTSFAISTCKQSIYI